MEVGGGGGGGRQQVCMQMAVKEELVIRNSITKPSEISLAELANFPIDLSK